MYYINGANPMLTTNPTVLGGKKATAIRKTVSETSKKNVTQIGEDHNWRAKTLTTRIPYKRGCFQQKSAKIETG